MLNVQPPQSHIEPHFTASLHTEDDSEFIALITARWSEHRAEKCLWSPPTRIIARTHTADEMRTNAVRANTPAQLHLVRSRLERTRLEVKVYSE